MFQEHIDHIRKTEDARTKLRKMLNGEAEEAKPITEERLCETINLCMEIISTVFKGEFQKMEDKEEKKIVLIRLEVFVNLDSFSKENDQVEIETNFEFRENLIRKDVKELVEQFTSGLNNYLNVGDDDE